jgi:putative flavoprotein involved in K+ transport
MVAAMTAMPTIPRRTETVVVGGGPAGLAVSSRLAAAGREHIVFERGRVGDTWRTQRWDRFRLNTPGWMTGLPDADGFGTANDLVAALERRAAPLPVREGIAVRAVWRERGGGYLVSAGDRVVRAENVVAASGAQRVPRMPAVASQVSGRGIEHLHVADYRSASGLPPGAVLVVGSGQSGAQIAEDLLASGRRVLLATSHVPRAPRRHRGRDTMAWWRDMGVLDDAPPSGRAYGAQALIAGDRELSLQGLARRGAILLGRVADADGTRLRLSGDPLEHAAFADAEVASRRTRIDEWIAATGADAAPATPLDLLVDAPLRRAEAPLRPEIDLQDEGVGSVIWATGFGGDFGWLRMPIHEPGRGPIHRGVETPGAGLFVLGLPWLTRRTSGSIWGIERDAELVATAITERADAREPAATAEPVRARAHRVTAGERLRAAFQAGPRLGLNPA